MQSTHEDSTVTSTYSPRPPSAPTLAGGAGGHLGLVVYKKQKPGPFGAAVLQSVAIGVARRSTQELDVRVTRGARKRMPAGMRPATRGRGVSARS